MKVCRSLRLAVNIYIFAGGVLSVSFNPSMKQLASGSDDNTVMVWNFKPQLRAFKFVAGVSNALICFMIFWKCIVRGEICAG